MTAIAILEATSFPCINFGRTRGRGIAVERGAEIGDEPGADLRQRRSEGARDLQRLAMGAGGRREILVRED